MMFADPNNGGAWLNQDGCDYCPEHWHEDKDGERVPGPELEDPQRFKEQA